MLVAERGNKDKIQVLCAVSMSQFQGKVGGIRMTQGGKLVILD